MAIVPARPLQRTTEMAQGINKMLTEKFEDKQAKININTLYQEGGEIIARQITTRTTEADNYWPVIVHLQGVFSQAALQLHFPLQSALSKTFRRFTEIVMEKCFTQEFVVDKDTRKKFLEDCRKIRAVLPRKQAIRARFEYKCAIEAITVLEDATGYWSKYFTLMFKAAGDGYTLQIGEVLKDLATLKSYWDDDATSSWYPRVFLLHQDSTLVKTPKDFQDLVVPKIGKIPAKGEEYALAIATVLKDLIKNNPDPAVKDLAFRHLVDILKLENQGWRRRIVDSVLPNSVSEKFDHFAGVRILALQYLRKMAKKEKYRGYWDPIKAAVAEYQAKATDRNRTDKQALDRGKQRVDADLKKCAQKEEKLGGIIIANEGKSRGPAQEEEYKRALVELEANDREKEQLETILKVNAEITADIVETSKIEEEAIKAVFSAP